MIGNDFFPNGGAGEIRVVQGSAQELRRSSTNQQSARRLLVSWLGLAVALGGACGDTTTIDVFNPDLGLLGHWAFDESVPGSIAIDSSGFGNHGKPSANPPAPKTNTAPVHFEDRFCLSFNGQDQWIELGNPPIMNLGGPITVAAWLRPADLQSRANIVAHGYRYGPNYDFALRVDAGSYVFTTWDNVNHEATAAAPASDVATWVHLCGVFDGASYTLYRNGVPVATTADTTAPQANVDAIWAIGARAPQPTGGADNLIQAEIDDVRIYGRALNAGEVEALYRR